MLQAMAEEVLVVPRSFLFDRSTVHGFTTQRVDRFLEAIARHSDFQSRAEVEENPELKQIIPYVLVRYRRQLFLFQRSSAGGEARLHGKYSIGVGGHINRRDVEGATNIVTEGLRRELEEELHLDTPWRARLVGVLNDESNSVSQVHFGLVHIIEVDRPAVRVRESESLTGRLANLDEVRALRDRMETWSQLILDAVDPLTL